MATSRKSNIEEKKVYWPEGTVMTDGPTLRAQLIAAGIIKEAGHGKPYLPISGPYTSSTK